MRHVPPHRLADVEAGRVDAAVAARIREHVDGCARCAAARERLREGRAAMAAIAETPAPELGWDHIGARIYWSRSTQMRRAARRSRASRALRWSGAGAALVAAGCVAAALWLGRDAPGARDASVAPVAEPAVAAAPEAEALAGVVTFAAGDARHDGRPLAFDGIVAEGAVLETGDGRVAVQFAAGSGFALGPDSRLEIAALDAGLVELRVEGVVDVDITRREPDQRFVVVAGAQRVVVRGTAFRVGHRDGALEVTCTRGEVVVTDGAAEVDVRAGERFEAPSAATAGASRRAVPLPPHELEAIERAVSVPLLPAFPGARAMLETTSALEVRAASDRVVSIDGAVVGQGRFRVRVMRGRHLVAGEGGDGRWIEAGAAVAAVADLPEPPSVAETPSGGSGEDRRVRRQQLGDAVNADGLALRCLDPLAKQGLMAGSYALFDVGVAADGSQSHLNLVDSNVSPAIQDCLRRALDAAELPPGPRARFRYRLAF